MEISLSSPLFRSSGVWEVRGHVPEPFLAQLGLATCKMKAGMFVSQGFQTQKEPEYQRRLVWGEEVGGEEAWLPGPARADLGSSASLVGCHGTFVLNKRFLQLTH